jgi:prophage antirepressor-like protein
MTGKYAEPLIHEDKVSCNTDTKIDRPSIYVNESGMYALIFGSKKPETNRFSKFLPYTTDTEI